MKKTTVAALASALAFGALAATPAMAGDAQGKFQVKVLGTAVLADGKIVGVEKGANLLGTVANAPQTKANDNYVPTVAVEYFALPNVSIETICCLTQHTVSGTNGTIGTVNVKGADLVDHVLILPATVTLKYHVNAGPIKPYVGVGPSVFFFIDEKPSAAAAAASPTGLAITNVKLRNSFGFALQAGVDVPINDKGLGVTLDAKKYFMDTKAHFYQAGGEVLVTKHSLDPWVLSAGLSYRF